MRSFYESLITMVMS